MYTKGAPEVVLAMCASELCRGHVRPLTPERRDRIARAAANMASRALRVLAMAYREHHNRGPEEVFAEEGLIFSAQLG